MADSDEEFYTMPLKDQRYFGAGIKRKRVNFVPSTTASTSASVTPTPSGPTASERYLSIVLSKSQSEPLSESQDKEEREQPRVCDVCKTAIVGKDEARHASSLVHQICLPHAHPPSALDRNRKGMTILQAYGWDPDERRGLGAQGEGILHPVKAKEKRDTVGLDVRKEDDGLVKKKKTKKETPQPVRKLDAGKIRQMEKDQKKKDQRLRNMFYANEDVERYLGGG